MLPKIKPWEIYNGLRDQVTKLGRQSLIYVVSFSQSAKKEYFIKASKALIEA